MPPLDRQRVQSLFGDCLALDAQECAEFLARECAGDEPLRAEVERLLACDTTEDPVAERIARSAAQLDDAAQPWKGRRVGAYRILDELGHGGMGSVFLAARDDAEYDARVAIKLIRGFPTPRALAHLRRERQLLATLNHPGIARLLDGGTTDDGEPYLVIEHVDGVPLSEWCARTRPALPERLRLMQALCDAVHHAHQRLIVHSDLKPANILVRADGRPVLLDFGIARLLDATDLDSRLTAARGYTPMYASPEQVAGQVLTSASDVHALGLILFELLAGAPMRAPAGNVSSNVPSAHAQSSEAAWIRADAARLRGDLDRTVAKATDDDPDQRYSSAAALARDIEHHLAGRPIEAAPDSRVYRTLKFVRRHALGTATAAAIVVAAVAFGTWLATERGRALRAEAAARVEAATANRMTAFLVEVFRNASPETSRGREPTVREVLDAGRERLDHDLADQPFVRARLLTAIGEIYTSIGQPPSAIAALDDAVAQLRTAAPGSLPLAAALNELCRAHEQKRDHVAARTACVESMDLRRAQLPPGHVDIGHIANALGVVEQEDGNDAGAQAHFHNALAIFEGAGDAAREDLASTRHNLGYAAARRRDYATARDEYARALAEKRALWGDEHPKTLNSLSGLALAEIGLGNLEAGQRALETLLALRLKVHGTDSSHVADAHIELASVLQDRGDLAGSETHYAAADALLTRLGMANTLNFAITANNHATLAEDRGDIALARALYRRSFALRNTLLPDGHPSRMRAALNLARFQLRHAARDDETSTTAMLAALPTLRTPTAIEAFDMSLLDAERALRSGSAADAERILRTAAIPDAPIEYRRRLRHAELLALAMLHAARAGEAADLYRAALDALDARLGRQHPVYAQAAVRAAMLHRAAGQDDEARRLLQIVLPVLHATHVEHSPARLAGDAWQAALSSGARARLSPAAWF